MHFGRENRVRLAKDFDFLKKNSTKADCSAFVFYLHPSLAGRPRLAVITSRKLGCAVERNTARRRFRAIFREVAPSLPIPVDILVFVRRGYLKFDFKKLKLKFERAAFELIARHEKPAKK